MEILKAVASPSVRVTTRQSVKLYQCSLKSTMEHATMRVRIQTWGITPKRYTKLKCPSQRKLSAKRSGLGTKNVKLYHSDSYSETTPRNVFLFHFLRSLLWLGLKWDWDHTFYLLIRCQCEAASKYVSADGETLATTNGYHTVNKEAVDIDGTLNGMKCYRPFGEMYGVARGTCLEWDCINLYNQIDSP